MALQGLRDLLAHRDLRVLSGQLVLLVPLVRLGRVLREQLDLKGHKETRVQGLLEQLDQQEQRDLRVVRALPELLDQQDLKGQQDLVVQVDPPDRVDQRVPRVPVVPVQLDHRDPLVLRETRVRDLAVQLAQLDQVETLVLRVLREQPVQDLVVLLVQRDLAARRD